VKEQIFHVAPDENLESWKIIRDGDKAPCVKGISKSKAVKLAKKLVEKKARPGLVLVHKTRYIIERSFQVSS
jgi:hypothetical protein